MQQKRCRQDESGVNGPLETIDVLTEFQHAGSAEIRPRNNTTVVPSAYAASVRLHSTVQMDVTAGPSPN